MGVSRILIVEDEPSIADSVVYALRNDGYEATVAGTGEKARLLVADEVFDLILLDIGLPEERTVGVDGFEALYRFSEFGRGMPQAWVGSERRSLEPMFAEAISGVDLIDPINNYRLVDRSLKYGLLFVGAGFGVLFLFEILRRLNLHPMQNVLAGGGIVMFFLLLLSLSEVIAFGWAYLWSTLASASLVGLYAGSILGQGRQGLVFGAVMAAMFGFLYIVLRQQDLALLAGSAFVFSALALVMYLTRKLDWSRSLESGR